MTSMEFAKFLLMNYHKIELDIETLEDELKLAETPEETIEGLALQAQDFGEKVQSSGIRDSTSRIALIYNMENIRLRRMCGGREGIEARLASHKQVMNFLDAAFKRLRRLNYAQWAAMKTIFIDGWDAIEYAAEYHVPIKNIKRYKYCTYELFGNWWNGVITDIIVD